MCKHATTKTTTPRTMAIKQNIRNNNNNVRINGGSNDHGNRENTVFLLADNSFDVVHSFDVVVAVVNLSSYYDYDSS